MKGEINWTAGLVLSAGSIIGSYVGSRFAVQEKSKVWIFRIIKMALLVELVPLVLRHQLGKKHLLIGLLFPRFFK
jgi:uncharacterized membrane protein YfcA